MVKRATQLEARLMSYERRACGRRAAHRSAMRTAKGPGTDVFVPGVRRVPLSELNRSPARCARESGGAPGALSPVCGETAPPAPAGPVSQPGSLHPMSGRIKSQIM